MSRYNPSLPPRPEAGLTNRTRVTGPFPRPPVVPAAPVANGKGSENAQRDRLTTPLRVGGCLSLHWRQWQPIGAESWVVAVLRDGYRIPFWELLPPPRQVAGIIPNVPARLSAGSRSPSGSREHNPEGSPGDRTRSGPRLLQPPLSSRKGIWRLETGDRPLPPQRICATNPVQDEDHRLSAPLGQKGRLPSLRGPERHVLPDPHPPLVQEVAPFRHRRDGPSVQGALLRTVNRPAGFRESFRDSIGLGPLPRCSTSPISGRLVGPGLLGDQSQAARPRSTLALSLPRLSDKRREV